MLRSNVVYELEGPEPMALPETDVGLRIAVELTARGSPLPRFYEVPGEASMSVFDQTIIDFNRAAVLRQRKKTIEEDSISYQSWLWTFANLSDGWAEERRFRRFVSGISDPGALNSQPVKKGRNRWINVNKPLACFLVTGKNGVEDTWGNHGATREEYLKRSRLSQFERTSRTVGKFQVIEGSANPPPWVATSSRQKPLEGYEHRARPVSFVEIQRRLIKSLSPRLLGFRRTLPPEQPTVSKPEVQVKRTETRAPLGRPLAVLAQKESFILTDDLSQWNAAARVRKDADEGGRESRFNRIVSRKKRELAVRLLYRKKLLREDLKIVQLSQSCNPHENAVSAYWFSWWMCPGAMRTAAKQSKFNYVVPTAQQVFDFQLSTTAPSLGDLQKMDRVEYDEWFLSRQKEDDIPLPTERLAKSQYNADDFDTPPPVLADMTADEFRLAVLNRNYARGNISNRDAYITARKSLGQLIARARVKAMCREVVAVGEPYGDPKRRSFTKFKPCARQLVNHKLKGLPSPKGFSGNFVEINGCDRLPVMNEMEYTSTLRTALNSIDWFVRAMVQDIRLLPYPPEPIEHDRTEKAANDSTVTDNDNLIDTPLVRNWIQRWYDSL